jgi:lysophospholipase L1-like esterase
MGGAGAERKNVSAPSNRTIANPAPLKRVRPWLVNLGVLVGATLLAAMGGELVVRLLFGNDINLFPRYHTNAHYGEYEIRRLRPNTEFFHTSRDGRWRFRTNAQGFRSGRDWVYDKPAGDVRVIALGDSQTMGFEVRQGRTYSAVIERYLHKQGLEAEALNTGVSGFSTAEELMFLENEGIRYHPDFVVLGFFANDFGDNMKADIFGLENGQLVEKRKSYVPGVSVLNTINSFAPLRWLSENSYLYSAVLNTVWEAAKNALLSRKRAELETEYALPKANVGNYEYDLTLALVRRMHAFCRAHDIRFIIVDIPQPTRTGFAPSVPPELTAEFRANADDYIDSTELFAPYDGVAEMFVPHGQRHISEFSHLMIGVSAAKYVVEQNGRSAARTPLAAACARARAHAG